MRGVRVSYDLEVYGKRALSARELVKVVSADRALRAQVDKKADAVDAVVWKRTFRRTGPRAPVRRCSTA
jgi:hypothetical protein